MSSMCDISHLGRLLVFLLSLITRQGFMLFHVMIVLGVNRMVSTSPAEDEFNLLVIVVDVNPIWWGQQAQREPEVFLHQIIY